MAGGEPILRAMRPLALLLLALAAPLAAQPGAGEPDGRRPPLYLVEHGGAKLYLLGSVHVLPVGALPLPDHVEAVLDAATTVVFEVTDGQSDRDVLDLLVAATDEATIADLLDASQRAALHAAVRARGWPGRALDDVEPWYGALRFSGLGPTAEALGEGVDAYLHRRALQAGKAVEALETTADQVAAFDDLPDAAQVAYLMGMVEADTAASNAYDALVASWEAGDEEGLWDALVADVGEGALFEALLLRRNRAWMPGVRALLDRPGDVTLVVVGAGHLIGPGSVVDLLRADGLKVRKL